MIHIGFIVQQAQFDAGELITQREVVGIWSSITVDYTLFDTAW